MPTPKTAAFVLLLSFGSFGSVTSQNPFCDSFGPPARQFCRNYFQRGCDTDSGGSVACTILGTLFEIFTGVSLTSVETLCNGVYGPTCNCFIEGDGTGIPRNFQEQLALVNEGSCVVKQTDGQIGLNTENEPFVSSLFDLGNIHVGGYPFRQFRDPPIEDACFVFVADTGGGFGGPSYVIDDQDSLDSCLNLLQCYIDFFELGDCPI